MAYLGNNIDAYQYTVEVSRFNGTGACTQFQIPQDVDDAKAIEVLVNSVQQDPDNSYTVVGGLITFTEAPSVGTDNILVLRREGTTFTRTQIDSGDILPNAVTTAAIADGSITASKIADGTIIAADIADGSITGPKLGQTAINANNIVDGGVTVAKGGTGLSTLTANSVVLGNGTDPVQLIAPGTTGNVLTSNGTNWTSQAAAAGGGDYIMTAYTTPATWTKPAGLKAVKVTVVGAGGNGGSGGTTPPCPGIVATQGGSGGGGGAAILYLDAPAVPGPITVTVGTAPSKTSSFGPLVSATGGTDGSAGGAAPAPSGPYAGGSGSGGTVNLTGMAGSGNSVGVANFSGSSALGFGQGINQRATSPPSPSASIPGIAGIAYGGGALGGRGPGTGASGGAGIVIVEEFY